MKILDLYITQVCNLQCEYCYVDVVKKSSITFPVEQFIERIDLTKYDHIKFFWGEPLLEWSMLVKIYDSVKIRKPKTLFTIVSNGILLDEKKAKWIWENAIELVVSIHPWSRKNLYKKAELLKSLWNKVGMYIIFNPQNFKIALKDIVFFSQAGIKNFCFAPEIYGDWNHKSFASLQTSLSSLIWYIHKKDLHISGVSHNSLKILTGWCEKTIFDSEGKYSPCNRFISLKEKKWFSYKPIYDIFSETLSLSQNPDRWFYTCPIGWYLDMKTETGIQESLERYEKLNQIFLLFFRELYKNKLTFLSQDIEEIRFNLTQQCNLRCSYCYVDFSNEKLEYITGKNIIDFFIEQKGDTKYISFFWGEPFLEFENLKKLTEYAFQKANQFWKKVYFTIATNFTLINRERINFLKDYDFKIHISLNGGKTQNDFLRDSSFDLVEKNMKEFLSEKDVKQRVCILFAFRPEDVFSLKENIESILSLGCSSFLMELIFWKEYIWTKKILDIAVLQMIIIQKKHKNISYKNIIQEKKYLDINTDGISGENSLEFFGASIDTTHKIYFNDTISKIFKH